MTSEVKQLVVEAKEVSAEAYKIKKAHFNHIDNEADQEKYDMLNKKYYRILDKIIVIKNYKGESGYHGRTSQDLARLFVNANYKLAK